MDVFTTSLPPCEIIQTDSICPTIIHLTPKCSTNLCVFNNSRVIYSSLKILTDLFLFNHGLFVDCLTKNLTPPLYLLVNGTECSFLRLLHKEFTHATTRNYKPTII